MLAIKITNSVPEIAMICKALSWSFPVAFCFMVNMTLSENGHLISDNTPITAAVVIGAVLTTINYRIKFIQIKVNKCCIFFWKKGV